MLGVEKIPSIWERDFLLFMIPNQRGHIPTLHMLTDFSPMIRSKPSKRPAGATCMSEVAIRAEAHSKCELRNGQLQGAA